MRQFQQFSVGIEQVGDRYQARCPELELFTHGTTAEEARTRLVEAIELFFELADASEIAARLQQANAEISLSFLLEVDPEGGYRAIALDEGGCLEDGILEDLCSRRI